MAKSTLLARFKRGDLISSEFEVLSLLGEGGCGSVYHCRWAKNPTKEVAVKLLDNANDLPRFIREAKLLRKTRHANVVRLLGSGFHDQRPYIALEYMDGGSVRDLMDQRGKLPVDEAAWILVQAISGLRASKTVHRDLKPENLLLARGTSKQLRIVVGDQTKGPVVKVADFGLARMIEVGDTRLTNSGQVMGTPVYMSPEQCRSTKNVGMKTDIYALGVIFFEMIVGKPPFDANNAYDIMSMHCNDEPKFPRMDKAARDVCARCLEKAVGKRYPSLLALERDLRAIAGLGEPAPDTQGWRIAMIVIIGLGFLAALVWVLRDRLGIVLPF
ncbi:MAG: serine/threonine protein kinase [Planctomycetes bacterium]|nr:serine/threonine protein kinase [Planctomycetota bacterium]